MRVVAERRSFGSLAQAKPNLFRFIKDDFQASERHAVNFFMGAVAKRFFLTEPTTAPGIDFPGLHINARRFTDGQSWQVFIRYQVHEYYLSAMNLYRLK